MNTLKYNNVDYRVVVVEDHLDKIMQTIGEIVSSYVKGEAVVADFSNLRSRGAKTSHAGISSGAASFAEAMDGAIVSVMHETDIKRYPPIAILAESHPDFTEFKSSDPQIVLYASLSDTGLKILEKGKKNITPRWELKTKEEVRQSLVDVEKQASPFFRRA